MSAGMLQDGGDARFAEVRRLIEEAGRAGLALVVAGDGLRCRGNIGAVSEALKARLWTLRDDVMRELSRPTFRIEERSSAPVRLPDYWLLWWSEMKVNPLLCNMHVVWHLRGAGCADRFRNATARVAARHPLLNARLADYGNFLQIEFGDEYALDEVRVTERPSCHSGFADGAQALAEEMVWAPLWNGRIFRPFLVEISPTEVLCGFVLHHLVSDLHAFQLVAEEVRHQIEFAAEALPEERRLQYSEYVRAMSQWEEGPGGRYRLAYWKIRLDRVPPVRLPAAPGAAAERLTPWHTVEFAIDGQLRARLAQVAERSAATLAQVLLAAKFVALAAMLRQADLVVTVIVSGRDHPLLLSFIGNLADCLPIRLHVDQSQSFRGLLERLRSSYVLDYRYRIKWELIMNALAAVGTEIVAPTFNFVSVGDTPPEQGSNGPRGAGISIERLETQRPPEQGSAKWYTSHEMNMFDTGRSIVGHVKYMPARQCTSVVEDFLQRFLCCLKRIAESPLFHVSQLTEPPTGMSSTPM